MLALALGSPPLRGYNAAPPPGARWSEGVRWQGRRMGDEREIMTAARRRRIAISAAVLLGIGCGMLATPASAQSLTDRFKSLFGRRKSDAAAAGAPSSVKMPLRVAVVQGGVQEKTIATKAYQTTVSMPEESSEPFSLVAEDLVYPVPQGADGDSYIFYIGFDPQALAPEPKPKAVRKKK